MWAKHRGLDGAISRPSDYAGKSNPFFSNCLMWKLHMGNPPTFLSVVGVYASFPCSTETGSKCLSTALCVHCKHNCPTAHHLPVNSPFNVNPFGDFGSFPPKQFQLVKCVWVLINTVSKTGKGDGSCCTCVNSWSELFATHKKQGNLIKYWIKASEGHFPVITGLL